MSLLKRSLIFILFVSCMLSLPGIAKRFTQGFRIAKLEMPFKNRKEWQTPFYQEALTILDQPFHYLDKGSQSYVFESEDGNYVIKFFRFDRPASDLKVSTLFNACKYADLWLREETGLVYVHLNKTFLCLPELTCTDPVGRTWKFQLDDCRFALQKKAKPFRQTLLEARENPELMKKRIDQFLSLLVARTEKGIFNTDPTLSRNFGFLEDRAIEIDFGNYRRAADYSRKEEVARYTERLRRWLSKEAPEWVGYLDERTGAIL